MKVLKMALTIMIVAPVHGNTNLADRFEGYRQYTLDTLRECHTDCELYELVFTITKANFVFQKAHTPRYEELREWCFPEDDPSQMFFNDLVKWNKDKAMVSIVHSALHLTGKCGPDSNRSVEPVCSLFGKEMHVSGDINKALKDHLKNEHKSNQWLTRSQ